MLDIVGFIVVVICITPVPLATIPKPTLLKKLSHEYFDFTNEELLQACAKLLEINNIKDAWQIVHIFLSRVDN